MPIVAAFITATVALLVPFITFYLNRTAPAGPGPLVAQQPLTVAESVRLLVVVPASLVLAVPAGFSAFGVAVVFNTFTMPNSQETLLFSLDACLTGGAMFALSLILHAGFNEPLRWWRKLTWYPAALAAFIGTLGFLVALTSNSIWALAHGLSLEATHVVFDSIDAAGASAALACLAALGCSMIEDLRHGHHAPSGAVEPPAVAAQH